MQLPHKKAMQAQCKTCPFKENQKVVTKARLTEIKTYLEQGTQHICHSTNKHFCRGARNHQINHFHKLGILKEPTEDAFLRFANTGE